MIDLDAARAARDELEPRTMRFGGQDFTLPATMPLAAAFAYDDNDTQGFLKALLGDQVPAFLALGADDQDLGALLAGVVKEYKTSGPKSVASSRRSKATGRR